MTGYELSKQFGASVGFVWRAKHSQIYPELRKLESEGLVRTTEVQRGKSAVKWSYSLTSEGVDELNRWVNELEIPQLERSAAHLKVTYLEYGSYDMARRHFRNHAEYFAAQRIVWQTHADALRSASTSLMQTRLGRAESDEARAAIRAYKVHVYEGLVARADAEISWAERGVQLVDDLQAAAGASGSDLASPARTANGWAETGLTG